MRPVKNLLLAGLPRVGKTTVVQKVLALIKAKCGGFYTQALDPAAPRRDFKLVTLEGRNRTISRKHLIRRFSVDNLFGLDIADLESKGVPSIRRALAGCQVVVIDEIGCHEALSLALQAAVVEALDSDKPVLATVPLYGTPFIETLKRRPDVRVVLVESASRVLLPDMLARELFRLVRQPARRLLALEAQREGEG